MNKIKILSVTLGLFLGAFLVASGAGLLKPGQGGGILTPLNLSGLTLDVASPFTVTGSSTATIVGDGTTSTIPGPLNTGPLDVNGFALFRQSYGSLAEFTGETATGTPMVMATSGVFYAWTGASSTISTSSGATYLTHIATSTATSSFTIGTKGVGKYQISFTASLMSDNSSNPEYIHCSIFKNGAELTNIAGEANLGAVTDERSISGGPGFVSLIANDVLDLRCSNETSSSTITTNHVNFGIFRVSR